MAMARRGAARPDDNCLNFLYFVASIGAAQRIFASKISCFYNILCMCICTRIDAGTYLISVET